MSDPAVSVVVPVYNNPAGLRACLEALAAQQTARPFEVIVVDDASTADLEEVRRAFAARLDLCWRRLPHNSGPAAARNAGIQSARGELVLFTDGDCRPEPGWLEALAAPFADPAVAGAKGVYRSDQDDRWARLAQLEFEERYELLARHADIDFVDTYAGAFRRADLLAVGGFDTSFPRADNEDVDLSFRVKARGGRFVFTPAAIVWHRHREGWWNYARLKFGRGFWRMKVYRRHPGKAGRDTYTPWTLKATLALIGLLPVALLWRRWRLPWLAAWLAACLPLARLAGRQAPDLLPWIPLFLFVRGAALAAGMTAAAASVLHSPAPVPAESSFGSPGRE